MGEMWRKFIDVFKYVISDNSSWPMTLNEKEKKNQMRPFE